MHAMDFDESLIDALRHDMRRCMRCRVPSQPSTIGAVMRKAASTPDRFATKKGAGDRLTAAAVETRVAHNAPGLDDYVPGSSVDVLAIWRLKPVHICSIQARYSSSKSQRSGAQKRLARRASALCTSPKTKRRAVELALAMLQGATRDQCRQALGIERDKWSSSGEARTYWAVREWLENLDVLSLLAWDQQRERMNVRGKK